MVLGKTLDSPLDCKEIQPVNPKGNQPLNQPMIDWKSTNEYSLEGLMLNLKLQYFDHLMQRAYSLEKTLMLEKIEDRRRREHRGWDGWMASLTQWTRVWGSSGRWWGTGKPDVLPSIGLKRDGYNLVNEQKNANVLYSISRTVNQTKFPFSLAYLKWKEKGNKQINI